MLDFTGLSYLSLISFLKHGDVYVYNMLADTIIFSVGACIVFSHQKCSPLGNLSIVAIPNASKLGALTSKCDDKSMRQSFGMVQVYIIIVNEVLPVGLCVVYNS